MCIRDSIYPDPEAAKAYDKKYNLYQKAIQCLDDLWPDMQAYIEDGD